MAARWDRRAALAGLGGLILPLGLPACGGPGLDQLAAGPRAKVSDVYNGDSIRLDSGQAVRLVGVEAPRGQEPYAPEAQAALADLIGGQAVQLYFGGAREDAYGRVLAHVRRLKDRAWVQQALLQAGAVRVRTYADNRALARPMLDAEARARSASRGLWTLLAYRVRLPEEAALHPFGFQIVEGRVAALEPDGDAVDVDLEHWTRAEIAPQARAQFASAGVTLDQLKGRLVRVRGELRPGPGAAALTLDHPEQLERLREA